MRIRFKVEFEDGSTHEVAADGRDIRKWEAAKGSSIASEEFGSFTSMSELARFAMVRQGIFSGTWEEFDQICTGLEEMPDEEPVGPTRKGRMATKSSPSQSTRGSQSSPGKSSVPVP
jgi:hypothetical protein